MTQEKRRRGKQGKIQPKPKALLSPTTTAWHWGCFKHPKALTWLCFWWSFLGPFSAQCHAQQTQCDWSGVACLPTWLLLHSLYVALSHCSKLQKEHQPSSVTSCQVQLLSAADRSLAFLRPTRWKSDYIIQNHKIKGLASIFKYRHF